MIADIPNPFRDYLSDKFPKKDVRCGNLNDVCYQLRIARFMMGHKNLSDLPLSIFRMG